MKHRRTPRTGASPLTDEELLIFDIAALDGGRRGHYRRAILSEQWNYPSHGLDDRTLVATLNRFEAEGLMTGQDFRDRNNRPDRTVRLTEAGGRLWESERMPDWKHYIQDSYPRNRISIYGHSSEICHSFFVVACESNLIQYDGGPVRTGVAIRPLIYWRPSVEVHVLCARVSGSDSSAGCNIDWELFERRRCWWRTPNELSTFDFHEPNTGCE